MHRRGCDTAPNIRAALCTGTPRKMPNKMTALRSRLCEVSPFVLLRASVFMFSVVVPTLFGRQCCGGSRIQAWRWL